MKRALVFLLALALLTAPAFAADKVEPIWTAQPLGRVERLVAWEITNAFLGSIRRPDLWDGPYVSSVTARVGAAIGGWSD